ncbi:MAG: ferredoxin [Actinomycetota bacterium]|nr:ferredoxin [Actinomycetota bacterium]
MKVAVDADDCAGHGACVVTCPAVFRIGDDGYAEVLVDEVPSDLAGDVEQAALECPTQAISIAAE